MSRPMWEFEMNTASIAVLAVIGILFTLAVRRVLKKGAPCECGGSRKVCSCKGGSCTGRCSCCH